MFQLMAKKLIGVVVLNVTSRMFVQSCLNNNNLLLRSAMPFKNKLWHTDKVLHSESILLMGPVAQGFA